MNKVLAFIGSPRSEKNTANLVEAAGRGAFSQGREVKYYNLNDPDFHGCQGCFHCRSHPGCAVIDYLQPAYNEIPDSPGIIVGTPVYFGDITGQTKLWLDRMFPMTGGLDLRPRYPGKRVATIFTQGNGDPDAYSGAIAKFHGFLEMFGWTVVGSLVCAGVGYPGFSLSDDTLAKAHALGEAVGAK